MSRRYLGGFITANPTIPTASSASGAWTLSQQNQYANVWPFGGPFVYVEDVFSTWLYTGTGSTRTIINGIDLAGEGGLVWTKRRSALSEHILQDTVRGPLKFLESSAPTLEQTGSSTISAFNSDGYTLDGGFSAMNGSTSLYASWTFREQPKFFDIVTYTGNGALNRQISHSLGSTPGFIIVKRTDLTVPWITWHRSYPQFYSFQYLNGTDAVDSTLTNFWGGSNGPTSSTFYVSSSTAAYSELNQNGGTYVAYLFAHNAGGFGISGNENVISCGSFTTDNGAAFSAVNLGYEPQYLLIKNITNAENWYVFDTMRGMTVNAVSPTLYPNLNNVETAGSSLFVNATGFGGLAPSGLSTYIYVAIRRPMKVPTLGTQVFQPITYTGNNTDNRLVDTGIVTDMTFARIRTSTSTLGFVTGDRLRGNAFLGTAVTNIEATDADSLMTPTVGYGNSFSAMNGFGVGNDATRLLNQSSTAQLAYALQRRPGFFDVVCYTGTGVARTVTHNLGVVPELMIVKSRNAAAQWPVYSAPTGNTQVLYLNEPGIAETVSDRWNNTSPTASVFTVGTASVVNGSGSTFVAYLFASVAGVSKIGSYTGTGTTQTINAGLPTGARFVLIKRTDFTGSYTTNTWGAWDTARGMVAGTDPSLLLNATAAEVNANNVYSVATGFQLVSNDIAINASGGSYIYLAIA